MNIKPKDRIQSRLLILAGIFLALYSTALTIAPVVRSHSSESPYQWMHWLGWLSWLCGFYVANRMTIRHLPNRDPYLLPIAGILSGWGLLTIWRLIPDFGFRQTAWFILAIAIFILGEVIPDRIVFLKRYKYIWLTIGLLITALTLVFGTNPSNLGGPRLWLGCCGIYFQPSEPLKLLLVIYLSAYFADKVILPKKSKARTFSPALLPLLAPAILITGLALLLLVIQKDLGTASIFLFLFAVITYIATGRRRIVLASFLGLIVAFIVGYFLIDVVHYRIDTWLNPWADPTNRSYQIVQSLIAVANGGLIGRGPGLGNPTLVPVSHSDFIFTAISEETGLAGAIGLIITLLLLISRGTLISLKSKDTFRRYLAAGLTAFIAAQSVLIISGNLGLLPLTGVTLPFLSYGGSSLVTSFLCLLLLSLISNYTEPYTSIQTKPVSLLNVSILLNIGLIAAALAAGWWSFIRGPDLVQRTDNPRRTLSDLYVHRGSLLDRYDQAISTTSGTVGALERELIHPSLSNIVGYTHPVYGQSGLESSLDGYLRGLKGNPNYEILLNQILYGQPPPGLDVRLSIDLETQELANQLLSGHNGAVVAINANSGEILAMASTPTYDANHLADNWSSLLVDKNSPLLNRAIQGFYPPGTAISAFLLLDVNDQGAIDPNGLKKTAVIDGIEFQCAIEPQEDNIGSYVQSGCPGVIGNLINNIPNFSLNGLFDSFHLSPENKPFFPTIIGDPVLTNPDTSTNNLNKIQTERNYPEAIIQLLKGSGAKSNPLQMALAAAVISNGGISQEAKLALAVNTPLSGWVPLSPSSSEERVFPIQTTYETAELLRIENSPYWGIVSTVPVGAEMITWFVGGTIPNDEGDEYAVVVLLEENDPILAMQIGKTLLDSLLNQ